MSFVLAAIGIILAIVYELAKADLIASHIVEICLKIAEKVKQRND